MERIRTSTSSQHHSYPAPCVWPHLLCFLLGKIDDLLMLPANSSPSTCALDSIPSQGHGCCRPPLSTASPNLSLFTGLFSPAYTCTVISSVLNNGVASVHCLRFLCYFSPMSPPSQVVSPSLYQNCPSYRWPPLGWVQWSLLSPGSSTWQYGHFLETLSSSAPTIPHSPLCLLFFFFKQLFIEV